MHASTASIPSFSFNAAVALDGRRSFARPRAISFYGAGTEIYAQGELAGALYRIEYGAVRIFRLLADGRRQVVAFHVAGETFGFEARTMRSFFAESIVPTGLTTLTIEESGRASSELMALALESMVRAQEHLLVVGKQSALEKVAVFLVDLYERQGANGLIDLPMTRTDIGDYLGLTIETVSRSFSKLRSMGVIRLKSARAVEVLNLTKLRLTSI
ncbi:MULTISPECIES: helix-turn-helix domain-containing protein [Ensifer]|uniref:helix-turn-helix domain-containing protein n=1 Tax=Ensifer TaxID=106591 RepID=UPI000DC4537B|nr:MULTISPECIES: helix-turn-helix domain-containing protein [Ensifer]MCY1745156.1 helix-turn-helix domain-containing protein [Ensifer sp. SL37]RAS01694.1 CRP/FNR family nitrogen fixation transcriptional regulator [Ensifer adhaerens]